MTWCAEPLKCSWNVSGRLNIASAASFAVACFISCCLIKKRLKELEEESVGGDEEDTEVSPPVSSVEVDASQMSDIEEVSVQTEITPAARSSVTDDRMTMQKVLGTNSAIICTAMVQSTKVARDVNARLKIQKAAEDAALSAAESQPDEE
ncbi:MAG: hypothetical protein SGARI_004994 [Bacillariaceae sp.]